MKAMILAAGRGERLKPLTQTTPKPLVTVGNTTLLAHLLFQLRDAGVMEVVMNVHHLKNQIMDYCGDGAAFGLSIQYSVEEILLETGGGIFQALPLLGNAPFLLCSADVWSDFPLRPFIKKSVDHAHLMLVDNPPFHPAGDFNLDDNGFVRDNGLKNTTYGNFALLHPILFHDAKPGVFPLRQVLRPAIQQGLVTGERYSGSWYNVGTLTELDALRKNAH